MRECSLPDCRVQNNFLTTFNVPTKDPDVRKQWIKFLKAHGKVVHENSAISLCELHFDPSDIVYGKFRKTLKHNSVPIALCSKQKVKQVESKLKKEKEKKEPIEGDEISVDHDHDYHSNGIFVERDELRRKVKLLEVLLSFEKKKNSKQSVTNVLNTKLKKKPSDDSAISETQELEMLLEQEREKNAKLRDKLTRHLRICTSDEDLEGGSKARDSEFSYVDEDTLDQMEVDLSDSSITSVCVKQQPKFHVKIIKNVK